MTTKETLYKFVQVGLGLKSSFELPSKVNWDELIEIAISQGVVAISFEGFQKMNLGGVVSSVVIMKWFGYSNLVQHKWKEQTSSAVELSRIWHEKAIRTLVLKGLAFGSYYPNPASRPSSDLDCYLCGKYEEGNQYVESLGCEVDREDYRHSSFDFKKVHVENHKICTTVRGKKQRKVFERYLRSLLETGITQKLYDSELEQPCLMFNALYFLHHAHRHFLREGFQLRYICDWAIIVKQIACSQDFDMEKFWSQCKKNDLKPFAESMSRVVNYVCAVEAPWLSDRDTFLQKQDHMLLDDCFNLTRNAIKYGNDFKAHVQIVNNIVQQRWKYKYFSEDSFWKDILVSVWCVLFESKPVI